MRTIFSRVKLEGKALVGLVLFMLATSVAEMMLPTLLAGIIDNGIASGSRSMIFTIATVMAVMAVIACGANIAATRISARISTKFGADLRREVFHHVQTFSASEMDKFGTASLVTRSTSDVTNVQMFLSLLLRIGTMAPLMAVAGMVFSSATLMALHGKYEALYNSQFA